MRFNFKNILHLFALFIVFGALFVIVVSPVLSFFNILPSSVITTRSQIYDEIKLDEFVFDPNEENENIDWQAVGYDNLQVSIEDRTAKIVPPKDWSGRETITFVASDTTGDKNAKDVNFSLNYKESKNYLLNIENQVILSGENFTKIILDSYLINLDQTKDVNWSYIGNNEITISIINNTALIDYPMNWIGFETIQFKAEYDSKTYSEYVTFIVNENSDYPFIKTIDDQNKLYTPLSENVLVYSSIIAILIFVMTPVIWYLFVEEQNIKGIFAKMKITLANIDNAFVWGLIIAVSMILFVSFLGTLLYTLGIDEEELSNVNELAENLSIYSMFFIIAFQSIGEEIFFRGFLLEKIESYAGIAIAIIISSILFGLAHMSYGKIYPAIMPMIMGLLLGYGVYRTKNLFASITAHMIFNLTTFILYIYSQSL